MLETFVGLLLVNLAGLIPPGTYTLIIIQYAKNKAKVATIHFITGSFIADILIASVLYLGFQPFLESPYFKAVLSLAGGLFLFWIGIKTFKTNNTAADESINSKPSITRNAFVKGLFVAILHPA